MKTKKWLQFSSLCLLLSLTVACGGKNSSGGSSGSSYSPISTIGGSNTSNLPSSLRNTSNGEHIVHVFNQALNWRNNNNETGQILRSGFTRGAVNSISSNSNCTTKSFLKFFEYEYCKGTSHTNQVVSFASAPTQFCTVLDDNNKLRVSSKVSFDVPYNGWGCNLGTSTYEYSKGNNEELNKVLSLNNGNWHIYGASTQGSQIYLMVGSKNVGPQFVYTIDTGYHSVYNPVAIQPISIQYNQAIPNGQAVKTLILQ